VVKKQIQVGAAFLLALFAAVPSRGAVVNQRASRFDRLTIPDPASQLGTVAETPDELPGFDAERAGWDAFGRDAGGSWSVHIDRRSGAPLLVQGSGIRFFAADGHAPTLAAVETMVRDLVARHESLFKIRNAELVLSSEGSGPVDKDHWILLFNRRVGAVGVDGERFLVDVTRGNLVSFGADRWGAITSVPAETYDASTARQVLISYMGLTPSDRIEWIDLGTELLGAESTTSGNDRRYLGPVGAGIAYHLAYRFVLRVSGEPGTWAGQVDATTGRVISFFNDARYAQVKGGVYPVSDDQLCPDGCEQPGWPMPYGDISINGTPQAAGTMGLFTCSPGGQTAATHLAGPYVQVADVCGAVSESVTCDDDLDLQQGAGTDCTVPAGASPGNTHSARSGFYHLNRIAEKGRTWLPGNTWLQSQLTDNVNLDQTCNAYWNGVSVNFFKSGNGCNNTGEIAGVFLHEWGHGLDANDGGGYDDPSETYADITALLSTHVSCVGRGFYQSQNCTGYGDACLNCTGIRDQDWDMHASHTPATPANFVQPKCLGGDSPCGREQHCETYVAAEALFDLATRDLTAAGLDLPTAWQLVDKLWFKSRQGSGGNAYNCTLPNSDGCGAGSWFTKLRNIDDDDGNLANGTPHAAAIFNAFARHAIACGAATDASNKNSSTCPALSTPTLTTTTNTNTATLSWTPVANAASYLILRNDQGCSSGYTIVASVPAPTTSYTETDLPNDFTVYYAVQAQAANTACEGPLSACQSATPRPLAGSIKLGQPTYSCASAIQVTVHDANIGSDTTTATIWSNTEPTPETVILTATAPGSDRYVGTIPADAGPPVAGNGILSIANGDTITAQYIDADDGAGGTNVPRQTTALADCVPPLISAVAASGIDDTHATVTWATSEAASSVVHYDQVKPPAQSASSPGLTTSHSVSLSGLQRCTTYWYSVESHDAAGNDVTDANGGQYYSFQTLGDLGNGLQNCHAGKLTLGKTTVSCADTLPIKLTDLDLNANPSVAETVVVRVSSTTETTPETITLTETGPNTSQFTGSIATAAGAPVPDGKIEVADGDIVSVAYLDADNGTGTTSTSEASSLADCSGAGTTFVQNASNTDDTATIQWSTTEATTGRVDWGPTPALGNSVNDSTLATSHSTNLGPLNECGIYYFRITTTDAVGNSSVLDNHGSPYTLKVWEMNPGVFKDGFETNTGWTLTSDWEIGPPQGKGTPPADPTSAFEGTKVLGEDLSGLGAHPGDYEPLATATATSPQINATTLTSGLLRFRRKLSTGDGGTASIVVLRAGSPTVVFTTAFEADQGWTLQTINISPFADGTSNLKIQFRQTGGATLTHSGWNIDRVVVDSGDAPLYIACGGCGLAPSFAGLVAAADANPCADTGVSLSWNVAASWGSGASGTYTVYRDTTPNFTPSATNRIAQGIAGTTYTDATAPNGVALYYLVRAENNETCSTGSNNHGVTDANTSYVSARDDLSQPAPGDVGATLLTNGVNDAVVRLTWSAATNAASYHVYRSSVPQGPFTQIGSATGLLYEDRDQFDAPNSWFYLVKAADSCGNEGP